MQPSTLVPYSNGKYMEKCILFWKGLHFLDHRFPHMKWPTKRPKAAPIKSMFTALPLVDALVSAVWCRGPRLCRRRQPEVRQTPRISDSAWASTWSRRGFSLGLYLSNQLRCARCNFAWQTCNLVIRPDRFWRSLPRFDQRSLCMEPWLYQNLSPVS